jgi:glycosyltransferase involved in cell wall biosynthesis
MRIAFAVVKHLHLGGGIEKYTREVAVRLARKGHEVEVYAIRRYGALGEPCPGVRIVYVRSLPWSFAEKLSAGATAAAVVACGHPRPDVVHLHSVGAGAFAFLHHLRRVPCVLQMHGIEWQRSRWNRFGLGVLRLLEWASIRQADALTAVSQVQCDFYRREYGVEMTCIPTGAEVREPTAPQEILRLGLQSGNYVLFASRLVREKGAHHLLRAFRSLNTGCHLVIAGDAKGEEAYKAELRALAGDDPRVRFLGFVQGRLLAELFSHARVYVQPSELEGLSIALLEAMSYANICLVSDIPENLEAIADTGLSFKNKDVDDLRLKLDSILSGRCDQTGLGERARNRVAEHFSWDRITDQLEALYVQVRASRTTASARK